MYTVMYRCIQSWELVSKLCIEETHIGFGADWSVHSLVQINAFLPSTVNFPNTRIQMWLMHPSIYNSICMYLSDLEYQCQNWRTINNHTATQFLAILGTLTQNTQLILIAFVIGLQKLPKDLPVSNWFCFGGHLQEEKRKMWGFNPNNLKIDIHWHHIISWKLKLFSIYYFF